MPGRTDVTAYQPTYRMQAAVCHSPQHQPGSYRYLEVNPVSGALGADVEGVDLRRADEGVIARHRSRFHLPLSMATRDARDLGQPMLHALRAQ